MLQWVRRLHLVRTRTRLTSKYCFPTRCFSYPLLSFALTRSFRIRSRFSPHRQEVRFCSSRVSSQTSCRPRSQTLLVTIRSQPSLDSFVLRIEADGTRSRRHWTPRHCSVCFDVRSLQGQSQLQALLSRENYD